WRKDRIRLLDLGLQIIRDATRVAVFDAELIKAESSRTDEHMVRMIADELIEQLPSSGGIAAPGVEACQIQICDIRGIGSGVLRLNILELLFSSAVALGLGLVFRAGNRLRRSLKRRIDRLDRRAKRQLRPLLPRGTVEIHAVA